MRGSRPCSPVRGADRPWRTVGHDAMLQGRGWWRLVEVPLSTSVVACMHRLQPTVCPHVHTVYSCCT